MGRFLDPKLSSLTAYTPGEQPARMKGLIKLNTNESPFPPSPAVVAAVDRDQINALRLYPDPDCASLISSVAGHYGVNPEEVFPCNGSDEALALCFHGLCPRGAAFPDISYGFYPVFAEMFGVFAEPVPLQNDFSILPSDYAGKKSTIFIANPNAPTGIYLGLGGVEEILAQDRGRLVILDEAYIDFGGESAISLLPLYDNLLVIRTFSKSRQLAGARIGFAIGGAELISDLNTMRFSFNPYNVNRLSLIIGEAAMSDGEYFEKCRGEIIKNRDYASRALASLGFNVLDSRANFIFVRRRGLTGPQYYEELRARGVLVRHFDKDRIRDFVRITIGTAAQMEELIRVTKDILKERGL